MAKYDERRIPYRLQDRLLETFSEVLCRLRSKSAVRNFLKDLLNRKERLMLVRRLLIAEMLVDGDTYAEIARRLRCGTPTIARVRRWLEFGRNGYKVAVLAKKRAKPRT